MEKMVFCTLFDSVYLDKGLVLFNSLCNVCDDFVIYVFAFDDDCFDILSCISDNRLVAISLNDFEGPELLAVKENRTEREYLWTCSSMSIKYVLDHYNENYCVYIDADMYFYQNPRILIQEIELCNADIGIMRHGFSNIKEYKRYLDNSGEFCVEFNYFKNSKNGRVALEWWCNKCLEYCSEIVDGNFFGDQKYLEELVKNFEGVHVFENRGGGVAPWNMGQFNYNVAENSIVEKKTHRVYPLVFFHFQQIRYISKEEANINLNMYPYRVKERFRNELYIRYLREINTIRDWLIQNYDLNLWDETDYVDRDSFACFLLNLIKYERDVIIALRQITRWIFRKKLDYVSWK
ncbi:hypothetical protein [Lacrimispora saccharolytica]|uniref:hypothetical protein n=1 Tax=Lacrimispora saccharolytica TaxID=84030 RepID=UPI00265CCCE9|nr:hypothetical protein [Lacrimispora saccharolytica]